MTREDFNFLDDEFNQQLAAKNAEIEKKYGALKAAQQSKAATTKIHTNDNLKMADKTHGISNKENLDAKKAMAANVKNEARLLEREMAKEKETFRKALEKEMWKDYGTRIQAKENAYGPEDPEVVQHKKEKEEKAHQLEEIRAALGLESKTGQATKDFNKEASNQNIQGQFKQSADRTR
jgi:hypothetical protein